MDTKTQTVMDKKRPVIKSKKTKTKFNNKKLLNESCESYEFFKSLNKENELLKEAKYITSILSSDNDELIYYYIQKLNIDYIFPGEISINKMIRDISLYSNEDMVDFIFHLLNN